MLSHHQDSDPIARIEHNDHTYTIGNPPQKLVVFKSRIVSARYLRGFLMKTTRFSDAQIMGFLKQAEGGTPVSELCREHGMSSASFYTWRAKFSGMDASLIAQMKGMAEQNWQLKRMYAEMSMQNDLLKEALGKKR
jgi:putative transposase